MVIVYVILGLVFWALLGITGYSWHLWNRYQNYKEIRLSHILTLVCLMPFIGPTVFLWMANEHDMVIWEKKRTY